MSRILVARLAVTRLLKRPFQRIQQRSATVQWGDLGRQTLVCSALVGLGDFLAQIILKRQNENHEFDTKRLTDMTITGGFFGVWYKESAQLKLKK